MNYRQIIDPVIHLQVYFSRLFMERHSLTPQQFLALNAERDIFGYLQDSYEPFHLTGDDGVLEELDRYVFPPTTFNQLPDWEKSSLMRPNP